MTLVKTYSLIETKAAIDLADRANINKLRTVRNDVTNAEFGRKKIRVADRTSTTPAAFQYPGARDVGHVFRHVAGTGLAGKSIYKDATTSVAVTRALLNSPTGQAKLQALQDAVSGRALYDNRSFPVEADVSSLNLMGSNDDGTTWQKIEKAKCQLLSLGDKLWIHTSYPTRLVAMPAT